MSETAESTARRSLPAEGEHRDLIEDLDNRINLAEVATLLGVGKASVHRWAQAGRLRTMRIGRRVFTTLADVRAMIEADRRGTTAPGD